MKVQLKNEYSYYGVRCDGQQVIRDYKYKVTLCGQEMNDYNYELIVSISSDNTQLCRLVDPMILPPLQLTEQITMSRIYFSYKVR